MKKILFTILFLLCPAALFAALYHEVYTNNVTLSWDKVDNAVYYDIYIDKTPFVRLLNGELSYTIKNLNQNQEYTITFGARDENNNTLSASKVTFTTGNYSGTYRFINKGDDNNGKFKDIEFVAKLIEDEGAQYMAISYNLDGEILPFFPFDPIEGPWPWIKFKDKIDVARVYKDICRKINILDVTPTAFQPVKVQKTTDRVILNITSKAFGIKVGTITEFLFKSDESGTYLIFRNSGSDIAKKALFKNEASEDPFAFVLEKVE